MPSNKKDPAEKALSGRIENVARNVIDQNNEENAKAADSAGLEVKIVRTMHGETCKWCAEKAGTYEYDPKMDRDVFRRHDNCDCSVDYVCETGRQDVWSKKWREQGASEKASRVDLDTGASKQLYLEDRQARESRIGSDNKTDIIPNVTRADIPERKISEFLIKPGAKHSQEFFDVGYTVNDSELLYHDIIEMLKKGKAIKMAGKYYGNRDRYCVIMTLGKTKKRKFKTVWQIIDGAPVFVTAHRTD